MKLNYFSLPFYGILQHKHMQPTKPTYLCLTFLSELQIFLFIDCRLTCDLSSVEGTSRIYPVVCLRRELSINCDVI